MKNEEMAKKILTLANVIARHLPNDLELAEQILDQASYQVNNLACAPFDGGRVLFRTKNEKFTAIVSPQTNGTHSVAIGTTREQIRLDQEADALMRSNFKAKVKDIHFSGLLPRLGSQVTTLLSWHEGELASNNLLNPEYEGGTCYLLLLKEDNMPFAIGDMVIEDAPIPASLFLVRTQKLANSSMNPLMGENNHAIRVTSVHCCCLDNSALIRGNSTVYKWPLGNAEGRTGRLCLGANHSSGALNYPDPASLSRLAIEIISSFPTTSHYGTHLKGERPLGDLMNKNRGKKFPNEFLIENGTLASWLDSCFKDLYSNSR